MSRTAPLCEQRRVAIVAFGFASDRLTRQPWWSVDLLAHRLRAEGRQVLVLTDAPDPPRARAYEVMGGVALPRRGGFDEMVVEMFGALAPERLYVLGGLTELARLRRCRLGVPVTYLLASPRLWLRELGIPPPWAWQSEGRCLLQALAGALIPAAWLRWRLRAAGIDQLYYLSPETRFRLWWRGLPWGELLHPALDRPRPLRAGSAGEPVITYLGPPLYARGADLAVSIFERASSLGLRGRLRLLLRPDDPAALRRFLGRIERSPVRRNISVTTHHLTRREREAALAASDVILLPFRFPVSEAPLVLFEAARSGRPLLALDRVGIGAYVRLLGGETAPDPNALARLLVERAQEPSAAPRPVADPHRELETPLPALRWIALAGPDGVGKTTLLTRLEAQLQARGAATRRRWSRYRHYVSKPLLGLLRLLGYSRLVEISGVRLRLRRVHRPAVLAWTFLALQVLDLLIEMRLRYRAPGRLVLLDRCVLDTLVDLAVDSGRHRWVVERLGPWLLRRLPRSGRLVVVERREERVLGTRPDVRADPDRALRRALYREMAARYGLSVLANDGTIETALARLWELLGDGHDLRVLQQ